MKGEGWSWKIVTFCHIMEFLFTLIREFSILFESQDGFKTILKPGLQEKNLVLKHKNPT